jgi:hypothetical protein
VLVALFAAYSSCTLAARQPVLKFLKAEELPAIGIKIKVLQNAQEVPLPPPSVYTYAAKRNGSIVTLSLYDPVELWRHGQQCGRWVDRDGNTMTLAILAQPPPAGFRRKHVSRQDFDARQAAATATHQGWNEQSIARWTVSFSGWTGVTAETIKRRPFSMKQLLRAHAANGDPNDFAYVFELSRGAAGGDRELPTWFFVSFHVNPQSDLQKAVQAIEQKFLPSIAAIVPSRYHSNGPSAKFQTPMRKRKDTSPEFQESCRQVVASIRGLPDWWYVETDHYIILSNMGTRHRIFVRDLQEDLEMLRTAYEQFLPPCKPISVVSTVRVFATPEEYTRHVGKNYEWSGGIWMPNKRDLVIRPMTWGSNREQRKQTLRTVYHEAFHQYVHYAMDQVTTSAWYNEGHAELFETIEVHNHRLRLSENDAHVQQVQGLIRSHKLDLQRLLAMSYAEFYSKDKDTLRSNYALAWAFIYYLRKDVGRERSSPVAGLLDSYADLLRETRDETKATKMAFAKFDREALQSDFSDFWMSRNRRRAAERFRLFTADIDRP